MLICQALKYQNKPLRCYSSNINNMQNKLKQFKILDFHTFVLILWLKQLIVIQFCWCFKTHFVCYQTDEFVPYFKFVCKGGLTMIAAAESGSKSPFQCS